MIIVFNPLKNIMLRGIPLYSTEYSKKYQATEETVIEISFPKWAQKSPEFALKILFIIWQQVVLPFQIYKFRPTCVFDGYNSYSIIGALMVRYQAVYHDFIPFENKNWFTQPARIYMRILHKISPLFTKLEVYAISPETEKNMKRFITKPSMGLKPNLVTIDLPDEIQPSDWLVEIVRAEKRAGRIILSTISGSSPHKAFNELLKAISNTGVPVYLVAMGFSNEFQGMNGNCVYRSFGCLEKKDLFGAMQLADINIFHSTFEGYGRPIIEALRCSDAPLLCNAQFPAHDDLTTDELNRVKFYRSAEDLATLLRAIK